MADVNFKPWRNEEPEDQNLQELWVYIQNLQKLLEDMNSQIKDLIQRVEELER